MIDAQMDSLRDVRDKIGWAIFTAVAWSMHRGYRGVLPLLGIILIGAQEPADHTQHGNAHQQPAAAAKIAATAPDMVEPPYRPYTQRYSDSCYNAQNHDTADLCAQWRAAIAAEKAVAEARLATIAAIVGAVLSLVTVVGLIVTILQTQGALGEARRGNRLNLLVERRARRDARRAERDQARAMELAETNAQAVLNANEIASDTAKRQLRAYIAVTDTALHNPLIVENKIRGQIRYTNSGQTPAYEIRCHVQILVAVANTEEEMAEGLANVPLFLETHGSERGDLGAGQSHMQTVNSPETTRSDFDERIVEGKAVILLRGVVRYKDVFGDEHATHFCWQRDREALELGYSVKMSASGNGAT